MEKSHLKFIIVGHVDHGKSTLIGRLLYDTDSLPADKVEEIRKVSEDLGTETEFAYLLDHLEEERRQNVTIDITQVFLKSAEDEYVIIDAPGHVEFVKNMITGASQAEAAVLIIDAKEGAKEQTHRHAYILSLLGIDQVVVVVNKMDLALYDKEVFERTKRDMEAHLRDIGIKASSYIPISALKGENIVKRSEEMSWYTGPTFLESLKGLRPRESAADKPLLFPIQDVYKIGDKRIIVGRVESGLIKKDETIKILPHNQFAKVSSIEKHPYQADEAGAGESIGITTKDDVFSDRGDIICGQDMDQFFTDSFRANIFWLSKDDFHINERLIIRCATQETSCRIEKIEKKMNSSTLKIVEEDAGGLKNLEVGEVVIKTKKPIAVKPFKDVEELGRFVLARDENTCAGGIITSLC